MPPFACAFLLLLFAAAHVASAQRVVVCEDREFDYWAEFRNCLLVFLPESTVAVAGAVDADPLAGVNDTYSRTVYCSWCRYPWVAHAEAYNDESACHSVRDLDTVGSINLDDYFALHDKYETVMERLCGVEPEGQNLFVAGGIGLACVVLCLLFILHYHYKNKRRERYWDKLKSLHHVEPLMDMDKWIRRYGYHPELLGLDHLSSGPGWNAEHEEGDSNFSQSTPFM